MPGPILSSQRIDSSLDLLIANFDKSFPNADICERLALNRVRHARARQLELAEMTSEIHPAASADPEIRRAHSAADRDFWRALTYLQRRLDHRARLAERQASPTPAYAATHFKPEAAQAPTTPAPRADAIAPANTPLTPTPPAASRGSSTPKPNSPEPLGNRSPSSPSSTHAPTTTAVPTRTETRSVDNSARHAVAL